MWWVAIPLFISDKGDAPQQEMLMIVLCLCVLKVSQYITFLEQWRKDWESRDAELYLRHYSRDYSGLGKDYKDWVQYKRRVNPSKNFIRVNLTDRSMFLYPGNERILVVTFVQDYTSNDVRRRFTKRQYWRREDDGKWRIIYEGSVS